DAAAKGDPAMDTRRPCLRPDRLPRRGPHDVGRGRDYPRPTERTEPLL
ncbi:MAG: hypothetical protein AVDCRST_MAG93-4641, partial [uncultured Chloroflexia bacterium]